VTPIDRGLDRPDADRDWIELARERVLDRGSLAGAGVAATGSGIRDDHAAADVSTAFASAAGIRRGGADPAGVVGNGARELPAGAAGRGECESKNQAEST